MAADLCIVVTTYPTEEEASALARKLLDRKLAACVQLERITSLYTWNDAVQQEPEVRLSIKTLREKRDVVRDVLLQTHSYEVPEVIVVEVAEASEGYLEWVRGCLA